MFDDPPDPSLDLAEKENDDVMAQYLSKPNNTNVTPPALPTKPNETEAAKNKDTNVMAQNLSKPTEATRQTFNDTDTEMLTEHLQHLNFFVGKKIFCYGFDKIPDELPQLHEGELISERINFKLIY